MLDMTLGTINKIQKTTNMWRNYFNVAIRNIIRNKVFSSVNIIGLSVGISVSVLILLYVRNELTYDNYHDNVENKYRVCLEVKMEGRHMMAEVGPAPLTPYLKENVPDVKGATRALGSFRPFISYNNNLFYIENMIYAEPELFDFFDIETLSGNPKKALSEPFSLVITDKIANKHFANENPIGKLIKLDNEHNYTIKAVVKEVLDNTHFQFDMLASFETLTKNQINGPPLDNWMEYAFINYIELNDNVNVTEFEEKITDLIIEKVGSPPAGVSFNFFLQKLEDIHLYSDFGEENRTNLRYFINIFSTIALFILLIACTNYMNLATARSTSRAKEI
jgi:hypothetical protein